MKLTSVICSVALVLIMLAIGCAAPPSEVPPGQKPEAPPVTGEITWGLIADLTGPSAPSSKYLTEGDRDAIRWVNESGMLNGVTIKDVIIDARYDPAKEVAAYRKLVDVDGAMVVSAVSSGQVSSCGPKAIEDQVVLSSSPAAVGLWAPDNYFFPMMPMWSDMEIALTEWWIKNEWKGEEPPRLGCYSIDAQLGYSMAKRFRGWCEKNNVPWVVETWSAVAPVDTTTQILALQKAEVDLIVGIQADPGYITFARDCAKLGYKPTMIGHWCMLSPSTMKAEGEAAVGWVSYHQYPLSSDAGNPGMKWLMETRGKWNGADKAEPPPVGQYFMGLIRSLTFAEATRIAIEEVGFDNLNGKVLKETLEGLEGYDCNGLIPPMSFSPQDHRGHLYTRAVRIQPGAWFAPITDYVRVPELSPEEMTVEYYKGK